MLSLINAAANPLSSKVKMETPFCPLPHPVPFELQDELQEEPRKATKSGASKKWRDFEKAMKRQNRSRSKDRIVSQSMDNKRRGFGDKQDMGVKPASVYGPFCSTPKSPSGQRTQVSFVRVTQRSKSGVTRVGYIPFNCKKGDLSAKRAKEMEAMKSGPNRRVEAMDLSSLSQALMSPVVVSKTESMPIRMGLNGAAKRGILKKTSSTGDMRKKSVHFVGLSA
jgi:hypothetical protein